MQAGTNMAPGAAETQKAIDIVNEVVNDLDALAISISAGIVEPNIFNKTY